MATLAAPGEPLSASGAERRSDTRIRTISPRIGEALDAGVSQSTTLRDLVDRLEESDLIVHIVPMSAGGGSTGGEMQFGAAAGGTRYVRVSVKQVLPMPQLIAMLAHELQHCLEVAESAQVVDTKSLRVLYESIGYSVAHGRHETRKAHDTGVRVLREVIAPVTSGAAGRR